MPDQDDRSRGAREGRRADPDPPPPHLAKLAGYGYLVLLGIVLTGLAVWFVLTRTSGAV